ncbi:INO80 complex subunit D isoform X2 [Clupea harengus]|uniref:INO80 complex subunit D isoform X2 n=1 Tax=Clupea harengus TaxID=7950 RepID=A0A6P8ERF2_CLUHA|nr:INO80 complex subunit D isoform X2 [Clupea harengus]
MYEGKHIHFSEVDNKPLCSYSPKLCKQRRLNGYAFCIRHVLEDKTAPFKQCEYVAKYNSQRCTNPIPKSEDRRYCNSHLQVLGFIPKKERKKKHEALEEMRGRSHLDSVALNITVPSLALKASNGLDESPPSPPCSRLLPLPDGEHLDPFAFYEEDMEAEEGIPRKGSSVRKKPQSRLVLSQRLPPPPPPPPPLPHDADHLQPRSEHFSPSSVHPGPHPSSPLRTQLPLQHGLLQLPKHSGSLSSYSFQGSQQGLLCKPAPPHTGPSLPPGLAPSTVPSPVQSSGPSLGRKGLLTATPSLSGTLDSVQRHLVAMSPASFSPPPACLQRLKHLVQLCSQRQQEHGDLFPHLGLDWSEDSGEDDYEDFEAMSPSRLCGRLQEGPMQDHSLEETGSSRRVRLAHLCALLQDKYKHLCRQERAATRQKRHRYAFRKALLHAAAKDPDCTAELIQALCKISRSSSSAKQVRLGVKETTGLCTGSTKGQACGDKALPFTQHCFQHILLNRSQQLFSSCTAKFADGQQCSIPVFDITHQTPLCEEHAKKMDNFLRGDGNRRQQQQQHQHHQHHQQQQQHHHLHQHQHQLQQQQQQQQRKPRKKTKPPALTKKHKKKRRRGPRRPQKPIPPALPQGNLAMPSSLALPTNASSVRSPSTPELSTDELPDDITNDIADIPNDLELNQEDFSDVLPRLPDDLQDFDLFEEEAEELVRALQAMGSYPDSLVCLSSMGELGAPGVPSGSMGDLLNGRLPAENFTSLELEENLLHSADAHFPSSPSPPPPPRQAPVPVTSAASTPSLTPAAHAASDPQRTFPRPAPPPHALAQPDPACSSPSAGPFSSSEHVPSPYSEHMASPHTGHFQAESPLLLEVPLSGVPGPPRSPWNHLPLSLADPSSYGTLMEGHLLSTSLSTPPCTTHPAALQPTAALSALPQGGLTGLGSPPAPASTSTPPSSSSSPTRDLLCSLQPKQQLPQFSAVFGHQLASHSGIPNDVQPSHSSTAPPTGFSIASATAASANSATPPFPHSN